jgi:Na+/proline symporter
MAELILSSAMRVSMRLGSGKVVRAIFLRCRNVAGTLATEMPGQSNLHPADFVVFAAYILVTVALGFWVARRGKQTSRSYFLGDNKLPWFVVGASMVATDISSEHFIANVGGAYQHGIVLAAG